MAEDIVQVTSGAGPKLHTWSYTVGANTVHDEVMIPGPYPWPTYSVLASSVSMATANDHILCLNAGASLKVRIVRIWAEQVSNATAVTVSNLVVLRTTTSAPTGGTAVTAAPYDTSAAAAGAAGRTLPAAKGTESTELMRSTLAWRQALLATATQMDDAWQWLVSPFGQPLIIPAGATNGIVVKSLTAVAGLTVNVGMEFVETAF